MKFNKTHYWNAFHNVSRFGFNNGEFLIEQGSMSFSAEDAIYEAAQYDLQYAYTIEVLTDGTCKVHDFSDQVLAEKYADQLPREEYERLTGHEMGLCMGRV